MVAAATLEHMPSEAAERFRATLPTEREERGGRALVRLSFAPALVFALLYSAGFGMQVFGR